MKIQRKTNNFHAQLKAKSQKRKATVSKDTVWIYGKENKTLRIFEMTTLRCTKLIMHTVNTMLLNRPGRYIWTSSRRPRSRPGCRHNFYFGTFLEQLRYVVIWRDSNSVFSGMCLISTEHATYSTMYSRLLVVDYEADKVDVAFRPVALPCQPDHMTPCDVGLELQDMAFTCWDRAGPSMRHIKTTQCVPTHWGTAADWRPDSQRMDRGHW